MPRPQHPDDQKPADSPAWPEVGGTRWELPVRYKGAEGVLVIRAFDVERTQRVTRMPYDTEASVRGRLVLLLDAERRNRGTR